MIYPPSYAMDATAASGGPSTVLPQILTGSPQTILSHVAELLQKAEQFSSLISEFEKAEKQLTDVWSGHAADSAVKKIESSLQSFGQIVGVIQRGATLLQQSAAMITTAQTGYTSVVGSVNPTVAGLMSNPYTYSAAVALSSSSSASLKGFITAIGGLLKSLGAVNLASEVTAVGQIISELEQLFANKGTAPGATGSAASTGSTPVTAPVAPGSVASAAGLQGLANPGTDPSATGAAAGAPTGTSATGTPAAASAGPTTLQNGEQGLLHTPDGRLYTSDGQPLLNANGQPAYQNYQPAALSGLTNGAATTGMPTTGMATAGMPTAGMPTTGMPTTGMPTADSASWLPVDPSAHAAATPPAVAPVGSAAPVSDPTAGILSAHGAVPNGTGMPTDPTAGILNGSGALPHGVGSVSDPTAGILSGGASSDPSSLTGMPTDPSAGTGQTADPTAATGLPVSHPAGHPGGLGDEVTITTTHGDTSTTIEVPLEANTEITVNAEGTVTVG